MFANSFRLGLCLLLLAISPKNSAQEPNEYALTDSENRLINQINADQSLSDDKVLDSIYSLRHEVELQGYLMLTESNVIKYWRARLSSEMKNPATNEMQRLFLKKVQSKLKDIHTGKLTEDEIKKIESETYELFSEEDAIRIFTGFDRSKYIKN